MSNIILVADKNGNPIGGVRANQAQMQSNTRSVLADRLALGRHGTSHAGKRDYFEILGYPIEPQLVDYIAKFERDPIGGRIIEFPPEETWRDTPTIKDGKDKEAKEDTEFCNAWNDFAQKMRVYHYCQRVDTLAGIGSFGLLHIGVAGHGDLKSEVLRVPNISDIIYLRPYSEEAVSVYEWQTNPNNPRYGLPHLYRIDVSYMSGSASNVQIDTRELIVHWSRCIHVADGLLENEVFGRPRLQRVLNLLDDILKVVGGSAEATWKLMRKGLVLNIDPEAEISPTQAEDLQKQFDEYDHGLRRFMQTRGMDVHDLGSEVVNPDKLFDVIITLVSIATRIPKRILLGSERGELASSQDAANWAGYIAYRQLNYAEPIILRPFIDRMIRWGAVPPPTNKQYTVMWDALFEQSDAEKADVANKWADAAQKMAKSTGHPVISAEEWRGEFTPFPADLPPELVEARERAQQQPTQGKDVLDQVADVLVSHGVNRRDAGEVLSVVGNLLNRGEG